MRKFTIVFALLTGCVIKDNSLYCDGRAPCPDGRACSLAQHLCVALPDLSNEEQDLARRETADLALEDAASDLSEVPDLDRPDLAPYPDLEPLPDLTPPTPYFIPDVQAILDAHTCARSGCHSAGDGLYVPFLIANPSTTPARHQNFVNFSAELQAIVFAKLVNGSGTAHGGAVSGDADRKPCSSMVAEPCGTLSRWYAAGALEVMP
jgi:hypothetical protein